MNSLSDIPIALIPRETEPPALSQPPSPQVLALLQELRNMLNTLASRGENNSIDVRSLPMLPGDYDTIKTILGEGEVDATVTAMGPTKVRETRIPGIWWVTHFNHYDEVIAEFIEVTSIPQILLTPDIELQHAVEHLDQDIDTLTKAMKSQTPLP